MNEEHRKAFLEKFPDDKHNIITQMFCFAVRRGNQTVVDILDYVAKEANERFDSPFATEPDRIAMSLLSNLIDTQEAHDFANFIWWRESLPKEDRLRMKYVRNKHFASEVMSKQPATEKQLKYLQGLGCKIVPENKQQASELIEKYK